MSDLTRKERRSCITGMVLGDANLTRNRFSDGSYRGNSLIRIGHTIKQRNYLEWKKDILQPMFGYELKVKEYNARSSNGKYYPSCSLVTRVNPQLTRLYKQFYIQGKKIVNREILDMVDDRGMAIWYMDDGCLSKSHCQIVILSTNNFSLKENELIRDWINDRYGVKFNINKCHGNTYCLRKGITEAYKLIDRITPYAHEDMMYKFSYNSNCNITNSNAYPYSARPLYEGDDIVHSNSNIG